MTDNIKHTNENDTNKLILSYEDYIYDYMDKIPIFEKYLIFNIYDLNKISEKNNNILKYEFNYQVSQILITYQKDLSYVNRPSILDNLDIFKNFKKKYNLNTNSLKYFFSSSIKKNEDYKQYGIRKFYGEHTNNYIVIKFGFIDIITNNKNIYTDSELIYDIYLGFKYFNNFKKHFPTFEYTYCYMKCTGFNIEKDKDNTNININENWCNKTDNNENLVSYIITETCSYYNNNYYFYPNILKYDFSYLDFALQVLSIRNYINNNFNYEDKNKILNFKIKGIFVINLQNEFKFKYFKEDGTSNSYFNTKKIVYISIFGYYKKINYIFNKLNKKYEIVILKDLLDFYNLKEEEIFKLKDKFKKYDKQDFNDDKNILNKYKYELKKYDDEYKDFLNTESNFPGTPNKKNSNFFNFFNFWNSSNNNDNNDNTNINIISLKKFVSEYCLNDLKNINNYNTFEKNKLEESFNRLIDLYIDKLNKELENIDSDIIMIYNKYVKFIDILVRAKCLDYKSKLYNIFEFKMNLADKIFYFDHKIINENQKNDMIYTIEESYKNLPNSNFFLNFISKTPLVDIIINAFIYYLFIYSISYLYYFIQNKNMEIIEKNILKKYITNENLGSIKKSLEYGIKIAYDLFNNYGGSFVVTWYRKLYQNGFINISAIFNKFKFILPVILSILLRLNIMNAYNIMFNYIIDAINKLCTYKFLRFQIKNLLSSNFQSMIKFLWSDYSKNKDIKVHIPDNDSEVSVPDNNSKVTFTDNNSKVTVTDNKYNGFFPISDNNILNSITKFHIPNTTEIYNKNDDPFFSKNVYDYFSAFKFI